MSTGKGEMPCSAV